MPYTRDTSDTASVWFNLDCEKRASFFFFFKAKMYGSFFARRKLKRKIKAKAQRCLVYIPTHSPTQRVSFDTTNQFQER